MKKHQRNKAYCFLELFSRMNDKDQQELLKHLNCDGCNAILECIHNAMWNKLIDVKKRKVISRKLKEHEKLFRYLNSDKVSDEKKHKKLVQVGSGIGLIVNAVLPYLGAYLN